MGNPGFPVCIRSVRSVIGSVFVRRTNWLKLVPGVAIGVMLAGAGCFGAMARAQAADPAAAQTPAAQAPAAAEPTTPAAPTTSVAAPTVTAAPQGGSIKGTVKAPSGVPLPGVAVTATSTLTGKKYTTTTDVDGQYQMLVPRNGRYVVKTELTGFAAVTQEVLVNASSENGGPDRKGVGV